MIWRKTIYKKDKDNKGKVYHNFYLNSETDVVFSEKGKNRVFTGVPKIVYREGESHFGEQIYIELLLKNERGDYGASTSHETVDVYFSTQAGILFLREALEGICLINRGVDLNKVLNYE